MSAQSSSWWKGSRGEWYVAAQLVFMALIFFGPRTQAALPAWPLGEGIGWTVAGLALMLSGGGFLVAGIVCLRRQLTPLPYPSDGGCLIQSEPFAVVLHPMYAGGLVLGWAMLVRGPLTLAYVAVFAVFVNFKARLEERWLASLFPEYGAYRLRVRRLVPFVY